MLNAIERNPSAVKPEVMQRLLGMLPAEEALAKQQEAALLAAQQTENEEKR